MCSSGLEALSCPFSTKFLRSTDLRFTTSPAIATYTLLPAGVLVVRIVKVRCDKGFVVIVRFVFWSLLCVGCAVAVLKIFEGKGILKNNFSWGGKGESSSRKLGFVGRH